MSQGPTTEELLHAVEMQYRTIIQMNRLLTQMVEELRQSGEVRQLYAMQIKVDEEEGVSHLDRPPMML